MTGKGITFCRCADSIQMERTMFKKCKNKNIIQTIFIWSFIITTIIRSETSLSQPKIHQDSPQSHSRQHKNLFGHQNFFLATQDIAISSVKNDRPQLPDSLISSSQNFIIHYTTQGVDAVSAEDLNSNAIPDRIETIADAFEKSYTVEIEQMNFQLPPSFEGGTKPYDVYVIDLVNNYAITVTADVDSMTWEQKNVSSYILFDNDFKGAGYQIQGDDAIKITAAHEFFHAIQLGYVFRKSDSYFYELTAVWMEDQVFDEVDNYLYYLDYFFSAPDIPLNGVSFTVPGIFKHIYGSCIFAFYIAENFGNDAIRQIWQRMPDQSAVEAANVFFKRHGSDFESEFVKFSVWNYFTGVRSRLDFSYSESQKFPEVVTKNDTIIDYYSEQNGTGYFLTATYYLFHPFKSNEYKVHLFSEISEHWRLGVAVFDENAVKLFLIEAEETFSLGEVLEGQTILVVPCNVDRFTNPAHVYLKEKPENYSFILQREKKAIPISRKPFQIQTIFPNPSSGAVTFSIDRMTDAPITLRVFNIQGQEVDQMVIDQFSEIPGQITWHASKSKKYIPSGIYFCQFSTDKFVKTEKIVLYR